MQYKSEKGQSLIELMIAIALGLFLLGVMMTILQSVKSSTQHINALVIIQENFRTAFKLFQSDLSLPNTGILDPAQIPVSISSRIYPHTGILLMEHSHQKIIYFISQSSRKDPDGKSILELNRKNLSESAHIQDAVLDHIQRLQIHYGQIAANGLTWLTRDQVKDWQSIKAVNIDIEMNSRELIDGKLPMQKAVGFMLAVG